MVRGVWAEHKVEPLAIGDRCDVFEDDGQCLGTAVELLVHLNPLCGGKGCLRVCGRHMDEHLQEHLHV